MRPPRKTTFDTPKYAVKLGAPEHGTLGCNALEYDTEMPQEPPTK